LATLLEAINIKRKMFFEFENTPFYCMEAEVNSPTARGGQTLVRLKMISRDNPYLALYARRNLRVRPSYIAACVITIWIVGLITWLVTRGK